MKLQRQYDAIHRFFKTTTESYDDLDWNGDVLHVLLNDRVIERYTHADLAEIIPGFSGL
ncbi:MAG: hypothetical protein MPL62_17305 [Alphaproteobacteria bacterium]|nr:hypothetical protein [Alphaproteobacteria bacterium]